MRAIRHAGVSLALHEKRSAPGDRLLLLHELGGSSADWRVGIDGWPGAVFALDLAGHGESHWRAGGAYAPELFAADADAALAALGPCAVAGAGLGAWVALLVAGARPDLVPAALLLPGRGLDGGGPLPSLTGPFVAEVDVAEACDPMVRSCESDVRPPDYAVSFATAARRLFLADEGGPRPPWWLAIRALPHVRIVTDDRRGALATLARVR